MSYVKRNKQNVEENIQKIIDNRAYSRKIITISGEYGIGKTSLFNEIILMLQYKNYLKISLEKGYCNSPVFLKEITSEFINRLGVDNNFTAQSTKIVSTILKLLPDINMNIPVNISLSFSELKKHLINYIEKRWGLYTESVDSIEQKGEYYIFELARIIQSALIICQSDLYVVIDNYEYLDMQTAMLLNILNERVENFSIIITMQDEISNLKNNYSFEFVRNFMQKSNVNNLSREIDLELFDYEDTKTYLTQNPISTGILNIDICATKAFSYSGGLPLFLSIICNDKDIWIDNELNDKGIKNILLDVYYRNLLVDDYDERKTILFYIVANEGILEKEILLQLIKKEKNEDIWRAFTELCSLNVIIESPPNCYSIKAPLLLNYIKNNIKEYIIQKEEYQKKILKAYCHLINPKNISQKYSRITKLSIELEKYETAYKYAIEGSRSLSEQMKYDTACDILCYLLENINLSINEKIQIIVELIGHLYNCKQMHLLLEYYYSYINQIQNVIESTIVLANIHIKAAKAHYYLNQVNDAIITAQNALNHNINSYIFFEAKTIIISSYDLLGDYENCFAEYDKCIIELNSNKVLDKDGSLKIMFDMIYQMRTNDVEECIHKLETAIQKQKNHFSRTYACCCNNLGIEYLMNGDFVQSKKYLEEAKALFLSKYNVEAQFILNNLGLYYLYSIEERDYEKARDFFAQAFNYAISPLQYAYILMNIASVFFVQEQFDEALEQLLLAKEHVEKCPDPIVHSYFHYNYACTLYRKGDICSAKKELEQSYYGLNKPQLTLLYKKRNALAKKMMCTQVKKSNESITTRRKFWAEQIYEPCELMFYN